MTTEKKDNQFILKTLAVIVLVAGCVYLLSSYFADVRLANLENETKILISEQEAVLTTIAEITARNGADSVTESIVRDCSITERSSFDTLLGSLNDGLTQTQLVELERLFGRCGGFFAERKSIMVARLAREIEVYESYVNQLGVTIDSDVSSEYKLEQWQRLAVEEQKRSALFSDLVTKQDEIITTLLSGSSPQSDEIQEILYQVNEIQETLVVFNAQIADLRTQIVSF